MQQNKENFQKTINEMLSRFMVLGIVIFFVGGIATAAIFAEFAFLAHQMKMQGSQLVEITRQITFMTAFISLMITKDLFIEKEQKEWITTKLKEVLLISRGKLLRVSRSFLSLL